MGTATSLSAKAGDAFFPPFVHRLSPAVGLSPFCAPAGDILRAERRINNEKNSVFWLFD